jgi:hypothetical protein
MKRPPFYRVLGEDGEMLTILSLLGPPPADAPQQELGEMSLQDAVARIYEIAGPTKRAGLVLSLRRAFHDPDTDAFTSEEDVPVQDVSDRLRTLVGDRANAMVVLNRLSVEDEARFQAPDEQGEEDEDEGGTGPIREAWHRFLEALRHLFNIAGEDGQPLTILSILVRDEDQGDGSGIGA